MSDQQRGQQDPRKPVPPGGMDTSGRKDLKKTDKDKENEWKNKSADDAGSCGTSACSVDKKPQ